MGMTERRLTCLGPHGWFRVAYTEWEGPPRAAAVLCVHGLARNGRDFDPLAEALSRRWRVVCPDLPGRGKSDWVAAEDYGYPLNLAVCAALIARLAADEVHWVGTSMGGLTGMMAAAQPGSPIRRLVMNDIGPLVAKEGLERIATYVGKDPSFATFAALEAELGRIYATFGLTPAQLRHIAMHSQRTKGDGTLGFAYDPRLGDFTKGELADVDLWPVWDRVECPTLLLRGGETDLLRRADAEAMTRRGPRARLVEFAGIGHAPALMSPDQIGTIVDFLGGG